MGRERCGSERERCALGEERVPHPIGLRERELGEEWEMREETLTRDFILGRAYGPGLGLGLFSEAGLISRPPLKIEVFIRPASVNRF